MNFGTIFAAAILCHVVGDYLTQTTWMANAKTKRWAPAWAHGIVYGIPFILITRSIPALLVIVVTHVVIDHYRLARYIIWAKNQLAPRRWRYPWSAAGPSGYLEKQAQGVTGYAVTPTFMAVWLMIAVDNLIHMFINLAAIWWL